MAILVTGGAGYIGSHIVDELINCGEDVVVIDNLVTGHIEAISKEAKFYKGDIRDKEFLEKVLEKENIDIVIHLAASSIVAESMTEPLKYYDNNVCGTKVLLEVLISNKINKIIFASSAAVYGNQDAGVVMEGAETLPVNTYGETKLVIEKMLKHISEACDLKYVIFRYFNVCGAEINNEFPISETHLIPLIFQAATKKRKFLPLYGNDYDTKDGTCIRDYVHVSDLAQAHILAVKYLRNGNNSDIFNLGCGKGYSVNEVIDAVKSITHLAIPVKIEARRKGDPAILVASNEKAKSILGWKPCFTNFETVISTAWQCCEYKK